MIRASLEEVGAGRSILLDRDGTVIAGNGVYEQAQALGLKVRTIDAKRDELVAVRRADLSGAAARRMALLDNRAAETAEWDESVIADMVADTPELLADLFDAAELAAILHQPDIEEVPTPPVPKRPITRPGDLWQLGDHRLLCGDSRESATRFGDASIDLIFTDPPYGHNNNHDDLIARRECALGKMKATTKQLQDAGHTRPIANDGPEANELARWFFAESDRVLKPGCCCCGGGGPDPQFGRWSLWLDEAIGFKQAIVWDKGGLGMGWHYRRCYELILVAQKSGAAGRWFGGNDVANVIRDIGKIIPSAEQHPTEKPVALAARFIEWHSQRGDLIWEPFSGSGTTIIAAEQLGRRCYAMEIEPKYCDVAVKRREQHTGGKATRSRVDGRESRASMTGTRQQNPSAEAGPLRWSRAIGGRPRRPLAWRGARGVQ